jgi:hypothetical protein
MPLFLYTHKFMRAFHGTSADNLESILQNGLSRNYKTIWEASEECEVYLWAASLMPDIDNEEEGINKAKQKAADNAEFTLAKAKDCRRLIIECEIEEYGLDETQGMEDSGSICVDTVPVEQIVRIWIDKDDLSFFKVYFAYSIRTHPLACFLELNQAEEGLIKGIERNPSVFYEIKELLWNAVDSMEIIHEQKR